MSVSQILETLVSNAAEKPQAQAPTPEVKPGPEAEGLTPTAPPEAPQPNPQDEDFARKFAALSREQKRLYEEKKRIKEDLEKLDAYNRRQELKSKDPLGYLKEEGLEFDSLINAAIKNGEEPTVEDKIKSIEDRITQYLKAQEDEKLKSQEQTQQEAIDNFKKTLEHTVKGDTDRWKVINARNHMDTVFQVIEEHYQKTNEIMPTDQAADLVEKYYRDEAQKLIALLEPSAQVKEAEKVGETPKPAAVAAKTQTLNANVTPTSSLPRDLPMATHERINAIKDLIKWNKI